MRILHFSPSVSLAFAGKPGAAEWSPPKRGPPARRRAPFFIFPRFPSTCSRFAVKVPAVFFLRTLYIAGFTMKCRWLSARGFGLLLWLLFTLMGTCAAPGQWLSQTFNLSNGWNAIYLRLTPFPVDLDYQFCGLPIRSVHCVFRRYHLAQFTANSGDLATRDTEWLVWYPADSPHRILTTLWNLSGNTAYLIECTTNCTWTFEGNPVIPARVWLPDNWNFTGLPVNPGRAPVFADYFKAARNINLNPAPAGNIYRVLPNGAQQDISSQTAVWPISSNEAYWIRTEGLSAFMGTVLALVPGGELAYAPETSIQSFTLWNDWGTNQNVTVRLIASRNPPLGAPTRLGDVPLLHFAQSAETGEFEWRELGLGDTLQRALASNEQWTITLAVDRSAMAPPGQSNATWQSVLEVTDTGGTLIWIPVVAEYGAQDPYHALWPYGLWVGEATLTKVTTAIGGEESAAWPVNGNLTMRLVVHFATNGEHRLLQQAVLAWTPVVTNGITNGYYRLYPNDRRVGSGSPAERISSVALPFGLNALMTGTFQDGLQTTYVIGYDDPANPFRHVYNPNHDNRDAAGQLLPEGAECYAITNTVTLLADRPPGLKFHATLWNPEEELTGRYTHTIHGLRREPVRAEGTFKLRRVCRTGILE